MEIQFCGAARHVTGSSHLITLNDGYKILLDCGLYQGSNDEMADFNKNLLFKAASIDCVILSHAHIDHAGRLPFLIKSGYTGRIHCTHATRSLCGIMLLDSAMIQERDADYRNRRKSKKKGGKITNKEKVEPLYRKENVVETMSVMEAHGYGYWVKLNDKVSVYFSDAGHILGSASVTLKLTEGGKERIVGFTGDIGRPNRPILRDPQQMPEVEYLICESTYGAKDHLTGPNEINELLDIVKNTILEKKGKLIIPAFSVGRTQEIVHMLDQLEHAGRLPKIPVIVDSPLAVNATKIFGIHQECYDAELVEYMLTDSNPFGFNDLIYNTSVEYSKSINHRKEPCIIISSSGMMNAGRVKHHISNNIENKKNTLLVVGYCAPNTLGGILRSGAEKVKLFGEWKPVNFDIKVMDSFSAHGDRTEMQEFLSNQKKSLKKLFLVHGVYESQVIFKKQLNEYGIKDIEIPKLGDRFVLD